MPALVTPAPRFHASFLTALEEEPRSPLYRGDPADVAAPRAFASYCRRLIADALEDSPRPEAFVPSTVLWWVESEELLGRVSIRHGLNEEVLRVAGHIGYWVRPSARKQGHGRAEFAASLPIARSLGIDPALLTCDYDNIASRKIIESCGGVYENRLGDKLRFWVPTSLPR